MLEGCSFGLSPPEEGFEVVLAKAPLEAAQLDPSPGPDLVGLVIALENGPNKAQIRL